MSRVSEFQTIREEDIPWKREWEHIVSRISQKRNTALETQQVSEKGHCVSFKKEQNPKTKKTPTPDQNISQERKVLHRLKQYHRKCKQKQRAPRFISKVRRQLLTLRCCKESKICGNDKISTGTVLCMSLPSRDKSSSSTTVNQSQVRDNFTQSDPVSDSIETASSQKCDKSTQSSVGNLTSCEKQRPYHLCISQNLQPEKIHLRIFPEQRDTEVCLLAPSSNCVTSDMAGQKTGCMLDICCHILNVENRCTCHKKSSQRKCSPCGQERVSSGICCHELSVENKYTSHKKSFQRNCFPCGQKREFSDSCSFYNHKHAENLMCQEHCDSAYSHTLSANCLQCQDYLEKAHSEPEPAAEVSVRCCGHNYHHESINMCTVPHWKHSRTGSRYTALATHNRQSPCVAVPGNVCTAYQQAVCQEYSAHDPSTRDVMRRSHMNSGQFEHRHSPQDQQPQNIQQRSVTSSRDSWNESLLNEGRENTSVSASVTCPVGDNTDQEEPQNCSVTRDYSSASVCEGFRDGEIKDTSVSVISAPADKTSQERINKSDLLEVGPEEDMFPASRESSQPTVRSFMNFSSSNVYQRGMERRETNRSQYAWIIALTSEDVEDLFSSQNLVEQSLVDKQQRSLSVEEVVEQNKCHIEPEMQVESAVDDRDSANRIQSKAEVMSVHESDLSHNQQEKQVECLASTADIVTEQVIPRNQHLALEQASKRVQEHLESECYSADDQQEGRAEDIAESRCPSEDIQHKTLKPNDKQLIGAPGSSTTTVANTRKVQKLKNETVKGKCKIMHFPTPLERERQPSSPSVSEEKLPSKESNDTSVPTSTKKQQDDTDNTKMDESDGDLMFEEMDSSELEHVLGVLRQQELLVQKENGHSVSSPSSQHPICRKLTAAELPPELQNLRIFRLKKMWTSPPQHEMSAMQLLDQDDVEKSHNPPKEQQDLGCVQEITQRLSPTDKTHRTNKKVSPTMKEMRPHTVTFLEKKCSSDTEPKSSGSEDNCQLNVSPVSSSQQPTEINGKQSKNRGRARASKCRAKDEREVVGRCVKRKLDGMPSKAGSETSEQHKNDPQVIEKPSASVVAKKIVKLDVAKHVSSMLSPPHSSVSLAKRASKTSSKSNVKCRNINAKTLALCGKPNTTTLTPTCSKSCVKGRTFKIFDDSSLKSSPKSAKEHVKADQIGDSDRSFCGQKLDTDWEEQLKERQTKEKEKWLNSLEENVDESFSEPLPLTPDCSQSTLPVQGRADLVGDASVVEVAMAHDIASCIILDQWRNVHSLKTTKRFVCPVYDKKFVSQALWKLRNSKEPEDITNSILSLSWKNVHSVAFRTQVSMFLSSLSRQSAFHMERIDKMTNSDSESNSSGKENRPSRPISTAITAVASRFILKGEWIEGLVGLLLEVQAADSAKIRPWCLPKLRCGRRWILLGPVAYLRQSQHFNTRVCFRNDVYVGVQATCDIPVGQQLFTTYLKIEENLSELSA